MLSKVNLLDDWSYLYNAVPHAVRVIDVPPMNFLMIDGAGHPYVEAAYKEAVEAVYSLSYALKFAVRQQEGIDYAIMPLESLWWGDDMSASSYRAREGWRWTAMMMQPEFVTPTLVGGVLNRVINQKKLLPLSRARLETYREGVVVQIRHVGSHETLDADITRLYEFMDAHHYERSGKYHEISLSNPAATPPDRARTILRQPIRPCSS
jgi:hypothetical protein